MRSAVEQRRALRTEALYAVLTQEQKKKADQLLVVPLQNMSDQCAGPTGGQAYQ